MPDRTSALSKLEAAKSAGLFDTEMEELVSAINSSDGHYTTSCCAGRIVVSESSPDNKKKSYEWLGKWHKEVSLADVFCAVDLHKNGVLWLSVEPMIIHVACEDMDSASLILKQARASNLKRSGIYQVAPRIIVELIGVDGFSAPIGCDGNVFSGKEHIEFLVRLANKKILCNREKRSVFLKELRAKNTAEATDSKI